MTTGRKETHLFLVGRSGQLPATGRSSRQRALVDAAFQRWTIPSSATVFPALVLAAPSDPGNVRPSRPTARVEILFI
jgi:hypothetical protein